MNQVEEPSNRKPGYYSYLLRLWRENGEGEFWRLSLQDTHTGERSGFAGLEELASFLVEQMHAEPLDQTQEETIR